MLEICFSPLFFHTKKMSKAIIPTLLPEAGIFAGLAGAQILGGNL
jgi:hypothetical protein